MHDNEPQPVHAVGETAAAIAARQELLDAAAASTHIGALSPSPAHDESGNAAVMHAESAIEPSMYRISAGAPSARQPPPDSCGGLSTGLPPDMTVHAGQAQPAISPPPQQLLQESNTTEEMNEVAQQSEGC